MNLNIDITKKAEEENWIIPLTFGGQNYQWVFTEKMTKLVTIVKLLIRNKVAVPLSFKEFIFPRIVPEEVLGATGWLTYHQPEAWYVSPKRHFRFDVEDKPTIFNKREKFKPSQVDFVLDPIQCVSLYYALYGKEIKSSSTPIKVFEDQGGWTWRHEALDKLSGLFKSMEFMRTEFVWIAREDEAEAIRNQMLHHTMNLLNEIFSLEVGFAKGDSCFVETHNGNGNYLVNEKFEALSVEPTIDLLCKRQDNSWSEICSASRYSIITKRFKIKSADKNQLWSGCFGIGINRVIVVFLEKFGFDPDKWPEVLKNMWHN